MNLLTFERVYDNFKLQIGFCRSGIPRHFNKITNWSKKQLVAKRVASIVFVSAMLPLTISPIATPLISEGKNSYEPNLRLDITSSQLVGEKREIPVIVPGESLADKQAREAAEKAAAEAKAASLAKAKADAEAAAQRNTVSRERRVYSDPSNFDEIYQRASWSVGGLDPRLLKAIHQVETGGSGSTSRTSYAGAQGPMQFLPSTWSRYGVDGNGDGVADINNVEDAIFTAAKYLKACGYPDIKKALWGYNPSTAYYNKVISIAHSYGM